MRFLALDIGGRRTGVAVGDTELGVAAPVAVIEIPLEAQARLLAEVDREIDEHGPDALVVGLPLNMDGSEGPAAAAIRAFGGALQSHTRLAVHFHDERLTSAAADERMARTGLTHRQKKARRDAIAAAEILGGFLKAREETNPSAPMRDAADSEGWGIP
ncbi:MAG: Holliday junction resolvase RuvX [Phycisphaerales bacterium]|nr:Holliday junction resolvase RuvX [Phycisphaerales bacterium]